MIKVGSRWEGVDKQFRVLAVVEADGHTWVHYREDLGIKVPVLECREYSCYEESFLSRFRLLPE
jgi:hypothetical protein